MGKMTDNRICSCENHMKHPVLFIHSWVSMQIDFLVLTWFLCCLLCFYRFFLILGFSSLKQLEIKVIQCYCFFLTEGICFLGILSKMFQALSLLTLVSCVGFEGTPVLLFVKHSFVTQSWSFGKEHAELVLVLNFFDLDQQFWLGSLWSHMVTLTTFICGTWVLSLH